MKRTLAWMLAVFLICGLLPVCAVAESETAWWEQDYWETDTLLELGAEFPTYHPDGGYYEIASPGQLLYLTGLWEPEDTNGDGASGAP